MMNIEFLKKVAATSLFVLAITLPSDSFAQHRVGAGNAKAPVRKATPARKPAARGGAVASRPSTNRPAANKRPAVSSNNRNRPGNNTTINRKPGNNSRPVVKNSGNRNNNIHVNNSHNRNNVHINNNHRTNVNVHVRPPRRAYVRPPYRHGGWGYYSFHPYYYHPFRPFHWGPVWHPWGFFVASLATTAIIVSVNNQKYHYDQGVYYRESNNGYTVVEAPVGATIKVLPSGYETVHETTNNYYYGGTFYEKSSGGYNVVAPTAGSVIEHLPEGAEEVSLGEQKFVKYGDTYYQPVQYNGKNMYEVAEAKQE